MIAIDTNKITINTQLSTVFELLVVDIKFVKVRNCGTLPTTKTKCPLHSEKCTWSKLLELKLT